MILVAGGTGRLGSRVVAGLLERGHGVRVLARGMRPSPADVAGAEIVAGSVTDPAAVERALDGAELVVSAVTGFPGTPPALVDAAGNEVLARAAAAAGAEVVLLSVAGAAPDSEMPLLRAKYAAEQALLRSGAPGTVIRPDASADLWLGILADTAQPSRRPLVFGRGDNPIGWVAVRDVAALVLRVVDEPTLRGTTYTLCGPERIGLEDLARQLMSARGWEGSPRHVPVAALHLARRLPGRAGRLAGASLAMDRLPPAEDDARGRVPDLPCTSVAELLAAPVT